MAEIKTIFDIQSPLNRQEEVVKLNFKRLVGRTLKIVEASSPDKIQRESLKSLIEQEIYNARDAIIRDLEK